jgi:hypothetical protein
MIQMDAEARSVLSDDPIRFLPGYKDGYQLVSGGAHYLFEPGQFPEYDQVLELLEKHGGDVPKAELPIDAIFACSQVALSYAY